jgi:integrase
MPHASLTETYVSRLNPKTATRVVDYFSNTTPKLSLRISPPSKVHKHGLRVWRFSYRFAGQQVVLTIGRYPAWTSDTAHATAREAQVCLDKKTDPKVVLFPQPEPLAAVASKPIDTVKEMWSRYTHKLDKRSDTYRRGVTSFFGRYVLPKWADRDIGSIRREELVDVVCDIEARGFTVAANHASTAFTTFFNFVVDQGKLTVSPALRLPKSEEKPRTRSLNETELVTVWRAAEELGGPYGRFIKLLILTLARRDEVAELPFCELGEHEIDDDGTRDFCWLLPAARNKSRRDFLIPLSPLARSILSECPNTGAYVFSSTGRRPIAGFSQAKAKLDQIIEALRGPGQEPMAPWTFHDLRRSGRTRLSALKIDSEVSERLLNHTQGRLRETYDRFGYYQQKSQALRQWSDKLSLLLADPRHNITKLKEPPIAA